MKLIAPIAAIAALMAGCQAHAQPSSGIREGQVIGSDLGQVVNGWTLLSGTHFQRRTTSHYVTTETTECCVTLFKRAGTYLLAHTVPIARASNGGVEAERVLKVYTMATPPQSHEIDCSILWITPVVSFRHEKTKAITSIVFDGESFVKINWQDPGAYCSEGD